MTVTMTMTMTMGQSGARHAVNAGAPIVRTRCGGGVKTFGNAWRKLCLDLHGRGRLTE